jgi:hypothetical protein
MVETNIFLNYTLQNNTRPTQQHSLNTKAPLPLPTKQKCTVELCTAA